MDDRGHLTRVHVLSNDERVIQAARSLDPERFELSFSENRDDALRSTKQFGAEIAVIELELGGFGVTRDLRQQTSTKDIRVVMLSDREEDRWLCKQAGADAVLIKPLADTASLIDAVESVIS